MEEYKQIEKSLGVSKQLFQNKFYFIRRNQSNSFLVPLVTPTPSQLLGFKIDRQNQLRAISADIITYASIFLKLPITTSILAKTILNFFYNRISFFQYDYRDVSMTCVFIAAKVEQEFRYPRIIALVFQQIFKILQQKQTRPTRPSQLSSSQIQNRVKEILRLQLIILKVLGYEIFLLIEYPHLIINSLLTLLKNNKNLTEIKTIANLSWKILNDMYRTKICTHYPSHVIATSSVFMAFLRANIRMPKSPWWILMQTSFNQLVQILSFFQKSLKYDHLSMKRIRKIFKKQNFNDYVFPWSEKFNNLRISKSQKLAEDIKNNKKNITHKRSRSRNHNKKKKNQIKSHEFIQFPNNLSEKTKSFQQIIQVQKKGEINEGIKTMELPKYEFNKTIQSIQKTIKEKHNKIIKGQQSQDQQDLSYLKEIKRKNKNIRKMIEIEKDDLQF